MRPHRRPTLSLALSPLARAALLLALSSGCDDTATGGGGGTSGREVDAGEDGDAPGDVGSGTAGSGTDSGLGGESSSSAGGTSSGGTDGGTGGGSSGANICAEVVAYLTSCDQLQGAEEASQNCSPDNQVSQCVVPCLMERPCDLLGDWPTPIEDCVDWCIETYG